MEAGEGCPANDGESAPLVTTAQDTTVATTPPTKQLHHPDPDAVRALQAKVERLQTQTRHLQQQLKQKDERILELEEELLWMDDDVLETKRRQRNDYEETLRRWQEHQQQHHPTTTTTHQQQHQQSTTSNETMLTEAAVWRFLFKFAGFHRYSLLSDEWHEAHPTAANQLFGFCSWNDAKEAVAQRFPHIDMTPPHVVYQSTRSNSNSNSNNNVIDLKLPKECTDLEQAFCIKLMDRTGLTTERTALLYGKNPRTIRLWKQKWVQPGWGCVATATATATTSTTTQQPQKDYNRQTLHQSSGKKRQPGTLRPFQSRPMISSSNKCHKKKKI